jgi:hypothetical protein
MLAGQAGNGRPPLSVQQWLAEQTFRRADVPAVRRFTRAFGARAGIKPRRLSDLVLAVSEAMACATTCGPGRARVRLWVAGTRAFCEVRGDGRLLRTSAVTRSGGPSGPGREHSEEEALRRCVLRQLADYVSVASGPDGVCVLLSMTVS